MELRIPVSTAIRYLQCYLLLIFMLFLPYCCSSGVATIFLSSIALKLSIIGIIIGESDT
jgi:hypothetical protein